MTQNTFKRIVLYCLIGSVAIGAVLAILFVLLNTWSWFEVRVLLSTIVIAVASLCVMACELARVPKDLNLFPWCGFVLIALSTILLLVGMWVDIDDEIYWKTASSFCIVAIATVHVCLLSVVPLASRFNVIFYIAMQISYGLAIICVLLVFEAFEFDDIAMRLVILLTILAAALSLVIPLLSRLSRTDRTAVELSTPLELRNADAIDDEIALLRNRIAELEKLKVSQVK